MVLFVTLSWEYKSVLEMKPDIKQDKIIGVDLGLIDLFVISSIGSDLNLNIWEGQKRKLKSVQRKISRIKKRQ